MFRSWWNDCPRERSICRSKRVQETFWMCWGARKRDDWNIFWREGFVFIFVGSRGALEFRDKDAICDDRYSGLVSKWQAQVSQ